MPRATDPRTGPDTYRLLLARLDRWFAQGSDRHPGLVPCGAGCTTCCHGPFDISVADAELIVDAVRELPEAERREIVARARALLDRIEALEPGWRAPHDVAAIGEERFDRVSAALAETRCPLLDDAGHCRVYASRPLVCRMIGLPMITPMGRIIENDCPIQGDHPAYGRIEPQPFDLEALEVEEWEALLGAARRLLGTTAFVDYETTIAAAIVDFVDGAATATSPDPAERPATDA